MKKAITSLLCLWGLLLCDAALAQNTLVLPERSPYVASPYPDRVVLTPTATPHDSQWLSWRTDVSVGEAIAQLALASDSPDIGVHAVEVRGLTQSLAADNGEAHFHQVRFDNLQAATLYVYRVAGQGTWSEWFQFQTASDQQADPFQVLYFGDAQNSVKSLYSRVVRQGILLAPQAKMFIHAGDMIERAGRQDDHWGEWFDAGSWMSASINQLLLAGNHEYDETSSPVRLTPQWATQFAVAGNGPDALRNTVFFSLYQGVLFVVLDSTPAVHDEAMAILQAQWLDQVLSQVERQWTVVSYHHPLYSVSQGVESPHLARHWRPLFERHGVDLVLQGHDHVYGRGQNLMSGPSGQSVPSGPVYVVSVAGPKMNLVSPAANDALHHTGEDIQLFQILTFHPQHITYESRTVTGNLYDAFALHVDAQGNKSLLNSTASMLPRSTCSNDQQQPPSQDPDGRSRPGRCWDGFNWR
jgi:3',5'-cyclic AMP phosphodiesterase CpdA